MALMPVDEALSRVLDGVTGLPSETVALAEAAGRILSEDLRARITQPPFDASAMDGYAVLSGDLSSVPCELEIIGEAPAGRAFAGRVEPGQCVRIFTGAPVPEPCDMVVIQEDTEPAGPGRIRILRKDDARPYVRPRGLDFTEGDALLKAGMALRARRLALAAAMNIPELRVHRRPVVAVLATGDELVTPGAAPRPDQIISSNNVGLSAFVTACGGTALDLGIARDHTDSISEAIARARSADVLVTIGGASVGDHDLVQSTLKDLGMELDFWRIAMRPGKPLMFGALDGMRVLGLPGNPVSALVCARLFLKPLIDRMSGGPDDGHRTRTARLAVDLPANDTRQDDLRATLSETPDNGLIARPFSRQDSSMLRTLADADALVVRTPHAPAARPGDVVEILPLDF